MRMTRGKRRWSGRHSTITTTTAIFADVTTITTTIIITETHNG
jgi:hypothetical protein